MTRKLREKLGVKPGDMLKADVENGHLVLTPVDVIPRSLMLTPKGQKKEAEAEDDIRHGRVKRFDTVEELFKDLEVE